MLHLDYAAIGRILRVQMREPVLKAAREIAAHVDLGSVTDAEVQVTPYTTDRAAAAVTIAHPAGTAMEAKHGTLRKAAAAAGYEVKSKKK